MNFNKNIKKYFLIYNSDLYILERKLFYLKKIDYYFI